MIKGYQRFSGGWIAACLEYRSWPDHFTTEEACKEAGGYFKPHLSGWMVHVFPSETDPAKVWGAGMGDDHGMEHKSMPGVKR
jgi:hypothetical protein